MDQEQLETLVRIVLQIGYDHWIRNGTAIKPDDAPLVAADVASAVTVGTAAALRQFVQEIAEQDCHEDRGMVRDACFTARGRRCPPCAARHLLTGD